VVNVKKCPLLGRTERVTAPTAPLPTAMESADGAPGDRSLDRGTSLSGVYAGTHAILYPPKGWRPNTALDVSCGVNRTAIPPKSLMTSDFFVNLHTNLQYIGDIATEL
jgi:hypothetical protein